MDILFDLDGTLHDPAPGIIGSVQVALRGLGLAVPSHDDLKWVIGPPLRVVLPQLGVASDKIDDALRLYRQNYGSGPEDGARGPAMFDAVVYDGIPSALVQLSRAGCRMIVATSKPHVFARPIMREHGLDLHFAAVHGAELDGTRDDKADLIRHIIATERVDVTNALMIGDRKFDCIGAQKNGLRSIGVTWGYGSMQELREAGATALCDRPNGLHRLALWLLTGHG